MEILTYCKSTHTHTDLYWGQTVVMKSFFLQCKEGGSAWACCATQTFKWASAALQLCCCWQLPVVCSSTSCLDFISSGRTEGKKHWLFANLHQTIHRVFMLLMQVLLQLQLINPSHMLSIWYLDAVQWIRCFYSDITRLTAS